jgi:hypothetical protein
MRVGARSVLVIIGAAAGCLTWVAPAALGATPIGQTITPTTTYVVSPTTYLQCVSPGDQYAAPSPGVITSWSFRADALPPQIRLKTVRAAPGVQRYTIVGESALESPTPSQLNTFPTRVAVQAGDFLGFFVTPGDRNTMASAGAGYNPCREVTGGDQPVGATSDYARLVSPTLQLDVSAVLESDADNDGFGDETQDACPADPALQEAPCDRVAPSATITKGPKDKTKKKQATFEFTGTDTRAVASFQCSLDGAAFATCTSPHTVKVKKGKHTFQVRAIDQAGNVGVPASDDWKRKKKRK